MKVALTALTALFRRRSGADADEESSKQLEGKGKAEQRCCGCVREGTGKGGVENVDDEIWRKISL